MHAGRPKRTRKTLPLPADSDMIDEITGAAADTAGASTGAGQGATWGHLPLLHGNIATRNAAASTGADSGSMMHRDGMMNSNGMRSGDGMQHVLMDEGMMPVMEEEEGGLGDLPFGDIEMER